MIYKKINGIEVRWKSFRNEAKTKKGKRMMEQKNNAFQLGWENFRK
jgi:hypothetical protein